MKCYVKFKADLFYLQRFINDSNTGDWYCIITKQIYGTSTLLGKVRLFFSLKPSKFLQEEQQERRCFFLSVNI